MSTTRTHEAYMTRVLKSENDWDYYLVLQRFISLLQDGHTRFFSTGNLRNKDYGTTTKQIN
jgi:hypothetical protein